ncbi:hypothetical protein [Brucella intermedia]|uniref:hypothetical protein n=1 Tax=Brucella intermedia TaxID=94625 RepID=UPI00235E3847|nr:hypothetical protein [Brucella intermedia]
MAERQIADAWSGPADGRTIRRYQHNIRTIRASGCAVLTPAMVDSLDPVEIELWFADGGYAVKRIDQLAKRIADLPDETILP